jgi:hypothetical protein
VHTLAALMHGPWRMQAAVQSSAGIHAEHVQLIPPLAPFKRFECNDAHRLLQFAHHVPSKSCSEKAVDVQDDGPLSSVRQHLNAEKRGRPHEIGDAADDGKR